MLEGDAEEPHQDRLGRHEQGNVRACPNIRSRWVAKEYNTGPRPDLFSATSPLEGVKLVISEAASSNPKGTVLLVIDVRRAYFYAKAKGRGPKDLASRRHCCRLSRQLLAYRSLLPFSPTFLSRLAKQVPQRAFLTAQSR